MTCPAAHSTLCTSLVPTVPMMTVSPITVGALPDNEVEAPEAVLMSDISLDRRGDCSASKIVISMLLWPKTAPLSTTIHFSP